MFKNVLNKLEIDLLIVKSADNFRYFTNFVSSFAYFIIGKGHKYVLTDMRYYLSAKEVLVGYEIVLIENSNYLEKIFDIIKLENPKNIGIEECLSFAEYSELLNLCSGRNVKNIYNKILEIRTSKSIEEINKIKKAQVITDKVYIEILKQISLGVSEKELKAKLAYMCVMLGADEMSFDSIIAFGENTAKPHHHSTDKRLEENNIVLMDFGVKVDGYCSDMTRCFGYKGINNKLAEIYSAVLKANVESEKIIRSGITCKSVDSYARKMLTNFGYGEYFSHSLGHGVGLLIHEEPYLNKNNDNFLLENSVITIEPGVYIEGLGGVRIEDMLAVKIDGYENLTASNKNLIII